MQITFTLKAGILSVLSFLFFSLSAYPLKIPEMPSARVSDYAGMLSQDTKENLENYLEALDGKTGIQIVVATFPSLEGESLEDFSIRLAEKWKIGHKDKDNGIIFLIIKQERKIRIEVGYGLEGSLPDATASSIIRNVIAPYFKNGDYNGGVTAGIEAIVKAISGNSTEYQEPRAQSNSYYTLDREKIMRIAAVILGIIAFLFLIDIIRYGFYASGRRNYQHHYSFFEWLIIFSITLFILKMFFYMFLMRGRGGFGGGSSSGWGGGSSFSGGGGGSFGGGGSSGGW